MHSEVSHKNNGRDRLVQENSHIEEAVMWKEERREDRGRHEIASLLAGVKKLILGSLVLIYNFLFKAFGWGKFYKGSITFPDSTLTYT